MSLIYLIGARGCGKTTTGRLLAQIQDCSFMDLDQYLQNEQKQEIAQIVATFGWDFFRHLESEALKNITKKMAAENNGVIATGGGVVLASANREYMAKHGHVCWLRVPTHILCARLQRNPLAGQRPALTSLDMREEVKSVLRERTPLYETCAHQIVDGSKLPAEICAEILRNLNQDHQST